MASGFSSLHPLTEQSLRALGVKSYQVTQGWGSAPASAGYHAPVGICSGRKFSHCVDLTAALISTSFMHRLWDAGFVAFARVQGQGWSGSSHIHAIHLGLCADDGQPHLLSGPRTQIVDFLKDPPRNGLTGHARLRGYVPSAVDRADLRRAYGSWVPDYPTRVLAPGGQQIQCYAWLESGTVTVEVSAFLRWWGLYTPTNQDVAEHLPGYTTDGRFDRVPVRALAEAVGLCVGTFGWGPDNSYAIVQIDYRS